MDGKISTFLISKNPRLKELLSLYLKESAFFDILDDFSDISELYNTISSLPKVLLIVDSSDYGLDFIESVYEYSPDCKIIAIKDAPDVNFIVKVVRAGAKEVLAYPIIKSEFMEALNRIADSFSDCAEKQDKCKMITVFSNKGGIGKTSIASNLAYELAQITKENVALVDLNFQFGDITTILDLKPACDISYMLKNVELLNKEFLLSTMERYKKSSLYVLADPPYFKQAEDISPKQIARLFEVLKTAFSYIIVDASADFDAKTVAALDNSNILFLATAVNLPALRNCQRCLDLFDKLGYDDDKVQLIVNRYMENDEISIEDAEKLLKKSVYWRIPNNYFAVMASINKGVMLSEYNSETNVARSYKELAIHVADSVFRTNLIKKFSSDNMNRLDNIFRS